MIMRAPTAVLFVARICEVSEWFVFIIFYFLILGLGYVALRA